MEDFERPYREVSKVKALTLFLFRPRAFLDYSTAHDVSWVITKSPDIRASYVKGEYKPDVEHTRANAQLRAHGLRRSLFSAGLIVGSTAVVAGIAGFACRAMFGALPNWLSGLAQAIAAALILWATLWELTRDLQSYGGDSLSERVHSWLFRSLYTVGTFVFFWVWAWQS